VKEIRFCKHHGLTCFAVYKRKSGLTKGTCKKCLNEGLKKLRKKNKLNAVNLFGGKCQICGYCRSLEALHFHHINPEEKVGGPARMSSQTERFNEEIKKCILLCANCHSEVENGITKIPEYLIDSK
jgi:5-methylcytosine-specific restriction endonuclease McrA